MLNLTVSQIFDIISNTGYILLSKKLIQKIGLNCSVILSELIGEYSYWEKRNLLTHDNCFFCTVENMENNTSLKRDVQLVCIKKLQEMNVLTVEKKRYNKFRYFKLNKVKIVELFDLTEKEIMDILTNTNKDKVENTTTKIENSDLNIDYESEKPTLKNNNILKNNNKNYNIYTTSKMSYNPFDKTLKDKTKQIKQENKVIKNKLEESRLNGNLGQPLQNLINDKLVDVDNAESLRNRLIKYETHEQDKEQQQKSKMFTTINNRLKEAKGVFSDTEVIRLLKRYLIMYQSTYNFMAKITWENILMELLHLNLSKEKLLQAIQESTTKAYRKIYPVMDYKKTNKLKIQSNIQYKPAKLEELDLATDENGTVLQF